MNPSPVQAFAPSNQSKGEDADETDGNGVRCLVPGHRADGGAGIAGAAHGDLVAWLRAHHHRDAMELICAIGPGVPVTSGL